jgi:hypothetical protein
LSFDWLPKAAAAGSIEDRTVAPLERMRIRASCGSTIIPSVEFTHIYNIYKLQQIIRKEE